MVSLPLLPHCYRVIRNRDLREMPNEGDKKELNCTKCQKATTHVFEIFGMIPEITLQWCCSICGTVILEKEVKMKASPRPFLEYLYQYSGVSARESIRTSQSNCRRF